MRLTGEGIWGWPASRVADWAAELNLLNLRKPLKSHLRLIYRKRLTSPPVRQLVDIRESRISPGGGGESGEHGCQPVVVGRLPATLRVSGFARLFRRSILIQPGQWPVLDASRVRMIYVIHVYHQAQGSALLWLARGPGDKSLALHSRSVDYSALLIATKGGQIRPALRFCDSCQGGVFFFCRSPSD
jgi:hypothetical protein